MNYNIISYFIYLSITFYITIVVGRICFNNGVVYLGRIIDGKPEMVSFINRLLLIGYYLLNLGYAALMLSFWPEIKSISEAILVLFGRIGKIVFLLGVMHYNNMLVTYLISLKLNKQNNLKPSSL